MKIRFKNFESQVRNIIHFYNWNLNKSSTSVESYLYRLILGSIYWALVTGSLANIFTSGTNRPWNYKEILATSLGIQNFWIIRRGIPKDDTGYFLQLAPYLGIFSTIAMAIALFEILNRFNRRTNITVVIITCIATKVLIQHYTFVVIWIVLISICLKLAKYADKEITTLILVAIAALIWINLPSAFPNRLFLTLLPLILSLANRFLKLMISLHMIYFSLTCSWLLNSLKFMGENSFITTSVAVMLLAGFLLIAILIELDISPTNNVTKKIFRFTLYALVPIYIATCFVPFQDLKSFSLNTPATYENGCHLGEGHWKYDKKCLSPKNADIVLVGDSHAAQWLPALAFMAKKMNLKVLSLTKSACAINFMPNPYLKKVDPACSKWNKETLKIISDVHPEYIFFSNHTEGVYRSATSGGDPAVAWKIGLVLTLEKLRSAADSVIYFADNAGPAFIPNLCLSTPFKSPESCTFPLHQTKESRVTLEVIKNQKNIPIISINEFICKDQTCSSEIGGKNVFRDDNHLSESIVIDFLKLKQHDIFN